jgi:hypothetical protein
MSIIKYFTIVIGLHSYLGYCSLEKDETLMLTSVFQLIIRIISGRSLSG